MWATAALLPLSDQTCGGLSRRSVVVAGLQDDHEGVIHEVNEPFYFIDAARPFSGGGKSPKRGFAVQSIWGWDLNDLLGGPGGARTHDPRIKSPSETRARAKSVTKIRGIMRLLS